MHDRFFFLHIPKTAGTSMHHLLEQVAGPYLHLNHPHESRWPAPAIWARFRGCGGHMRWSEARQRGFLDGFSLTFLRDPIERVLSHYSFSRQSPGRRPEYVLAQQLDLRSLLLQNSGRFGSFWNAQTHLLSGLSESETRPEKHLESALENLEKFDFVGMTDRFSDDVIDLVKLLDGNPDIHIPSENRTTGRLHRDDLDEETIAVLDETQALDQLLCTRARELRSARTPSPLTRRGAVPCGWPPPAEVIGNGEATIKQVTIREANGGALSPGKEAEITVCWSAAKPLADLMLGFAIEDVVGNYIAGTNTFLATENTFAVPEGEWGGSFKFKVTMGPGRYLVNVALHRDSQNICWINSATTFEVDIPVAPYREGMIDIIARSHIGLSSSVLTPLPDSAASQVRLEVKAKPQYEGKSGEIQVMVGVVNGSEFILSSHSSGLFFVSYHWLSFDNKNSVYEGLRSNLPRDVWPDDAVTVATRVLPPPAFGKWLLQIRLLQEGVRWHEGTGFEGTTPQDLILEFHESGSIILLVPVLQSIELTM